MTSHKSIRLKAARDLGRSSGIMTWLVYPVVAILMGLGGELWKDHPGYIVAACLATTLAGLPRLYAAKAMVKASEEWVPFWLLLYELSLYSVAMLWSCYSCVTVLTYKMSWTTLLALLTTFGITASSTAVLSTVLRAQQIFILLMTLPQAICMAAAGDIRSLSCGLNALVFTGFALRVGLINYRRYYSLQRANAELAQAQEQLALVLAHEQHQKDSIRRLEERWSSAFQGNGDGVWDCNVVSGEFYGSPRLEQMLNMPPGIVHLTGWTRRIHPDDRQTVETALEQHFRGELPIFHCEVRMTRRGGGIFWAQIRGKVLERDAAHNPLRVVGTCTDIDQQRQLQTQLAQARNLESIGQLSAGIAHEINTPLQFISDNLSFLKESWQEWEAWLSQLPEEMLPADHRYLREEMPSSLSQSQQGLQHIHKIVHAMKDFSHSSPGEKLPIQLNEVVETSLTICRHYWKFVAEVETRLAPDLPAIPAVRNEISQVVLNLLVNAADAIADRKAGEPELAGKIRVETQLAQDCLVLSVRDNGCGIAPNRLAKIFDPFYTTKPVGRGTGQGLSLCHSTVRRHGGEIRVTSQPGLGSTFEMRLPL